MLSSISRPAELQKCGTTMLIRPRAIWSRSRVAPIWRKVSSSSACRISAGSRNCSSAGGGMRMITNAVMTSSLPRIGWMETTASTGSTAAPPLTTSVTPISWCD